MSTTFEQVTAGKTPAQVLEALEASEVREYGIYADRIGGHIAKARQLCGEDGTEISGVTAALNNADTDYVQLSLLAEDPAKVLLGLRILAFALGTDCMTLYLPAAFAPAAVTAQAAGTSPAAAGKAAELASRLQPLAEEAGVALKTGIVDMRAERYAVHIHIVTAADIADCFDGGISDTVLLSVNGQEPQKVARKAAVGELADLAKAKAVYMNYRYMTPEEAAKVTADSVMNGLVTVLTGSDCVVADCEKRLLADRAQSCGKCVFCREGLIQLGYMQKEITQGRGKPEYLDLSREIGEAMCVSDLCSLGQETAKKALSGMETFAAEYGEHIRKKNCPAGVCMSKEHYYIDPKLCTGCGDCEDVCPADSIEGRPQYIYMIDDLGCTRCGKCIEACGEQAIQKTAGRLPKLPDRLTRVGRFHAR